MAAFAAIVNLGPERPFKFKEMSRVWLGPMMFCVTKR
jgi:hypothetical protein